MIPEVTEFAGLGLAEPLLRAIEWGLKVQPELRPQSVAEWQAAFEAQAQLQPQQGMPRTATTPANTSAVTDAVTRPRPLTPRSDPGAGWRHLGLGLLLVLALLVGIDWHRRNPLPPSSSAPASATGETPAPAAAEPPAAPATDAAPAGESPVPGTVDAQPSHELTAADPRERPPRPELVPDRQRSNGAFRAADRDGDGYLSPAEVEGRFPAIVREFGRVDRDGDQRISPGEFADLRRMQQERRAAPAH